MRERVFTRHGKTNVILVCPHGPDDNHTADITKKAADIVNGWAVVNQGFERSDHVDADNDKANCNRIDHITQPVVTDEFLQPMLKFKDLIQYRAKNVAKVHLWNQIERVLILHVHGVGDGIHRLANEPVEVVVGYGLGIKKDSITCKEWRKNLFIDAYRNIADDGEVFEASGGSKYAGRSSNNLNQYFRKHENERSIDSLQLEFPFSVRKDKKAAEITAAKLALVIEKLLNHSKYESIPHPKFI